MQRRGGGGVHKGGRERGGRQVGTGDTGEVVDM